MTNVIPMPDRAGGTAAHDATATPTPRPRAVYTVAEVAELLGLASSSVYAMLRAGEIPAKRMGTRWVIPKHRFHIWLDGLPEAIDDDVRRELGRSVGGDK